MNAIDFLRESAVYLVSERPDLYDMPTAIEELSRGMDTLREGAAHVLECVLFSSFALMRIAGDGFEEFILTRKITGMLRHEEEEGVRAYSYDPTVPGLPFILALDEGPSA